MLPLLVGLQAFIVVLLVMVGLLPFELNEVSAAQWASIWLGSASATALIIVGGPSLRRSESTPPGDSSLLPATIPIEIAPEGVVLASGRDFLALGFVMLPSRWNAREGRTILDVLLKANQPVVLILARTSDEQDYVYLVVPKIGDARDSALEGVRRATIALHRALEEQGVGSQRVGDELGVEQLYWLCVLGRAFHEDVQLCSEGRLVKASVGPNPPRLLATFALEPERLEQPHGNREAAGLVRVTERQRAFFLAISLTPVPAEVVAGRLRRLAARAPEVALLAEALGEGVATQAYAELQSSAMGEAALLLRGRKEGLWLASYRLVCAVADAPVLTENLAFTPHLLGDRGFTETATMRVGSSGRLVATSSLLNLIGQPKSRRRHELSRARPAQGELDLEEN